jgi:hypothetical protein
MRFTPEEIRFMELRVAKWLGFHTEKKPDGKYYLLNQSGKLYTSWAYSDESKLLGHYPKFGTEWQDAGMLFDLLAEHCYSPNLHSNMLTHSASGTLYAPNQQEVKVYAGSSTEAILCLADAIAIRGRELENNRNFIEDSLSEREL